MDNPILVEVMRGGQVESRHRGAVAVCDADGRLVLALGDVARPVFPRSAVKGFQALPLIESGAADRYGLTDAEIALCCASHSGEPEHVSTALGILAKAGQGPECLECGAHWPSYDVAARKLAGAHGEPTALNNNCSGKHSGFICLACGGLNVDPKGYVGREHPVQQTVRAAMSEITGAAHDVAIAGTDGCSIPTYAVPLQALALGFARFGTGHGVGPERAKAAARIRKAVAAAPFMVGGTRRFDSEIMQALGERAFTKTGAEGVFCATFPELGLGVALKIDDGASRASEVAMAALIARFLTLTPREAAAMQPRLTPTLRNWNGIEVGALRPAGPLSAAAAV
jgi:L-asparaginase II